MKSTSASSALAIPAFRRYFHGLWFSTFGFWMLRVALGWSAWTISESAFATGLVAALSMIPAALLAPFFGVIADRIQVKRAIQFAASSFLLLSLLLFLMTRLEFLNIVGLCVIALVYGTVGAAWQPLRHLMPARLVDRELLPSVVGLTAMTFHTSRILGPAVAGLLIANFNVESVYLVVALAYSIFLILFRRVELRARPPANSDNSGFIKRLKSGFVVANDMPEIRPVLIATFTCGVSARGLLELLSAIAGGLYSTGFNGLAWLTSSAGAGAVFAGFQLARLPSSSAALTRRFILCGGLACMGTAIAGVLQSFVVAVTFCGLIGFLTTMTGTSSQALLQITVQDEFRGRIMGLWTVAGFGGAACGSMLIGMLGDRLGLSIALLVTGLVGLCVFVWLGLKTATAFRRETSC